MCGPRPSVFNLSVVNDFHNYQLKPENFEICHKQAIVRARNPWFAYLCFESIKDRIRKELQIRTCLPSANQLHLLGHFEMLFEWIDCARHEPHTKDLVVLNAFA